MGTGEERSVPSTQSLPVTSITNLTWNGLAPGVEIRGDRPADKVLYH